MWQETTVQLSHKVVINISLVGTAAECQRASDCSLNELEWDNLAISEWKAIDSICRLLQPCATLSSGEEYTTVSGVLPIIMELNLHLEEQKHNSETSSLASQLQSDVKRCFKKYTDPGDLDYQPLFLVLSLILRVASPNFQA